MFGLEPGILALIGTIVATVGVAIVERWLTRQDRTSNDAAQIRSELKEQVVGYKEEIRRLEDELDEWRSKYYVVLEELVGKRIELQNAIDQIQRLVKEAEAAAVVAKKIIKSDIDTSDTV